MEVLYKRGVYKVDKLSEGNTLVQINVDGTPLTLVEDQVDFLDNTMEGKKFIFNPEGVRSSEVFLFDKWLPYEEYKTLKNKECEVIQLLNGYASILLNGITYCVNVRCLERIKPVVKTLESGVCACDMSLVTSYVPYNYNESGDDKMKLLELWKSRSIKKLEQEYEEEKAKIVKNDYVTEVREQFEEMKNNFIEEYKDKGMEVGIDICMKGFKYSRDTYEALSDLKEDFENSKKIIDDTYEEVSARLEICENEESKIKVLKDFDILGKNGRLDV